MSQCVHWARSVTGRGLGGVSRRPGLCHCEEGGKSPWEGGGCKEISWELLKSMSICESVAAACRRQGMHGPPTGLLEP